MTISIWRYSHLALALVSGLFLVFAALTGIVLAFEPMQSTIKPYQPEALSEISLSETIGALQREYDEVLTLTVDANDFLLAEVVTKEGEGTSVYIHPRTAEILGKPRPQHPIFQFTTNLHRSLFLKSVGRFFVGLVSFLLCLIAVTGLLLIIKRQGGVAKLFSKVQKDYFELRYHVVLGRWFLVPIILIAATGVYLSAEKFSLLPTAKVNHALVEPETEVDLSVTPKELALFQKITLDEIRSVSFPFSEFPEDYFEVALVDRELYVHQYTGAILSEQPYPFTFFAHKWSILLHTGQGSLLWAIVLLLASISLLFFIYSGFVLWRRRVKSAKVIKTTKDKDDCTHIILVGSETGSTYAFAEALEQGLSQTGKEVFVGQINAYGSFQKAEYIIFLTATYGEGEAPTNARHIKRLLAAVTPERDLNYSVVGFGSLEYPKYCQFAIKLDAILAGTPKFKRSVPLVKINNQSIRAFTDWARAWGRATETDFELPPMKQKGPKPQSFKMVKKTQLNVDDTFLLHLKPQQKVQFQSGDLWGYVPEDGVTRWYSIAKINGVVVLSVKRHEFGLCSRMLNELELGQKLKAGIKDNPGFHFPKATSEIICIGNGTGIAPFLGILDENKKRFPIHLYWGGRTQASFGLYQQYIDTALHQKKLHQVHFALSQESDKKVYVQQLLERDAEVLAQKLETGAVIMICGSLAMQKGVLAVLETMVETKLQKSLDYFEGRGQLLMDCY